MIEIKVDPATCGAAELTAVANMFSELATAVSAFQAPAKIAALDNPSTGAEVIKVTEPAPPPGAVFGNAALPPAASVAPAPPSVQQPSFETTPAPGAVFGGAPLPNGAAIVSSPPGAVPLGMAASGAPANVDVDKNGMPWDVRIHAGTKTKNADGTWRYKRGVQPASIKIVEDELRAVMALPNVASGASGATASTPAAPNAATIAPPPPPPPASAAASPALPAPTGPAPSPVAAQGIAGPASPSNVPGAINTYVELAGAMTGALVAKKLTQEECGAILFEFGVSSLPLVAARPDLIPAIGTRLQAYLASKGA